MGVLYSGLVCVWVGLCLGGCDLVGFWLLGGGGW